MSAFCGWASSKTDPANMESFRASLSGLGFFGVPAPAAIESKANRLALGSLRFRAFRQVMRRVLGSEEWLSLLPPFLPFPLPLKSPLWHGLQAPLAAVLVAEPGTTRPPESRTSPQRPCHKAAELQFGQPLILCSALRGGPTTSDQLEGFAIWRLACTRSALHAADR